ncbi:MAG: O-antigen ligase family protein [Nostocales cyanobacterium 94392]|nr:O-antigen ligase family protein [Nostocales cyanobacterium 94392]
MAKSIWFFFKHPDLKLRFSWYCLQLGLFIFPLFPALGAVGLFLSSLITCVRECRRIIKHPLYQGFILLSLLLVINIGFAADKTTAFLGLFNLLPFFLLFAGWSHLIQTTWQLKRISWILTINSLPVVIIGMGQLFLGWSTSNSIFGWTLVAGGNPPERMASVFMYANTLAGYLVIVFILSLALWLQEWRKLRIRGQGDGEIEFSVSSLILLTFAVIINFAGLILTNSRNAWVIALVACLAYAVYQKWRSLVAICVTIATSIFLAAFAPPTIAELFRKVVPAFFWARFNDQLHPDRPVALMRTTQWNFAWSLTMQRPWTGWGLRSFSDIYQAKMNLWLGHPHNLFLMLSAETGLPATLLFYGLLGWVFIKGARSLQIIPKEDKLIFFSYLLVFAAWILFNTVDVTLFDFRLNTFSWLMLSAVARINQD